MMFFVCWLHYLIQAMAINVIYQLLATHLSMIFELKVNAIPNFFRSVCTWATFNSLLADPYLNEQFIISVMISARTSIHALNRAVGIRSRSQLFDGEHIMIFLILSSVMSLRHMSVAVDCSSSSSRCASTMSVFLFWSSMIAMILSIFSIKKLLNDCASVAGLV